MGSFRRRTANVSRYINDYVHVNVNVTFNNQSRILRCISVPIYANILGPQWSHPLSASVLGGVVATGANTLSYYAGGTHMGPANGVIAKMTGITPDHPTGTGWDLAIGVR